MKIPKTATRIPLRPLAFGEATGHSHRLICEGAVAVEDACELYEWTEDGKICHGLRVTEDGVSLIHAEENSMQTAEHHRQAITPGDYRVVIQEETTDWGKQRVID